MIRNLAKRSVQLLIVFSLATVIVHGQVQKPRTTKTNAYTDSGTVQQPLYSEYKGVRLGITADEVQAKLGKGIRADDQEFFIINNNETATVLFDKSNKVLGVSVDYLEGVGAPDYRTVVGPDIITKPDGGLYKMVRYERLGFWVSYSRTATTTVFMVTITMQKIP